MQILITGASGVIGADLVKFFSKNYKIFAMYRSKNYVVKNLKNRNIKWIKHDLKKKITNRINPDIVIHCAVVHNFSRIRNSDLLSINSTITNNIINFCKNKKIKIFFHLSSLLVYGQIKKLNLNENHPCDFSNLYSKSKLFTEKKLNEENFSCINLRLPGVITYYHVDIRRPWIIKTLYQLIKNKNITIYNHKRAYYNFIDTIEVYKLIKFIIRKKKFNKNTINFACSKPLKINTIINKIKLNFYTNSKIITKKRKELFFKVSTKKCLKDYGYKAGDAQSILKKL